LACAFFAAISGSNMATAVAMSTVMVPRMVKLGYSKPFSVGLTCGSGCLGVLIPPSVTAIIYGSVTEVSIGKLFIAGVIPGAIAVILLAIPTIIISIRRGMEFRVPWLGQQGMREF
jgi:C4-dicarboxylate transporter DctM subunit